MALRTLNQVAVGGDAHKKSSTQTRYTHLRTKRTLLNMAYALGSSLLLLCWGAGHAAAADWASAPRSPPHPRSSASCSTFSRLPSSASAASSATACMNRSPPKTRKRSASTCPCTKWSFYRAVGSVIALLALVCVRPPCRGSCRTCPSRGYTVYSFKRGFHAVQLLSDYPAADVHLHPTGVPLPPTIDFCCNVLNSLAKIAVSRSGGPTMCCISACPSSSTSAPTWLLRGGSKGLPPTSRDVKVTLADFKDLGIFHDLRYYLVHRLSNTIYGSSDTIVTPWAARCRPPT